MAHKRTQHLRRIYDPLAAESGYVYDGKTGKGHLRYRHPETRHPIIVAGDLGNWRVVKNQEALFRKAAKGVLQNRGGPDRKR